MDTQVYDYIEKCMQKEFGTSLQIQQVQALSGGCINAASLLNTTEGDYFVKWNKNVPDDLFLREADCLKALAAAKTDLIIPEVFLALAPQENYPGVLLTEYLPPAQDRSKQDEILGRGLAQLHQFTSGQFGFQSNTYCGATLQNNDHASDWVSFYSHNRLAYLLDLIERKRGIGKAEKKIYDQLLEKLPDVIGHQPQPALNHGDLWSGNYMYTQKGPALIDPASAFADRELDLALTTMFGGFSNSFWQAYQETYPLPSSWKERNPVYMLYHYLNHFYLFGGGYGMQALQIAKKYI